MENDLNQQQAGIPAQVDECRKEVCTFLMDIEEGRCQPVEVVILYREASGNFGYALSGPASYTSIGLMDVGRHALVTQLVP